jgi:SSS family solute:Na+ symporter
LYARAALPDLSQPAQAYPMLAEITLPTVAKGLFYVSLLATIMSTLSSLSFVSATAFGKDIAGRSLRLRDDDPTIDRWTKIGLILSGVLSVLLALLVPSVVKIWYTIGTAIIPGLLIPVVSSYSVRWRMERRTAFWCMLLGWGVATASLVYGQVHMTPDGPAYWLGIEPMYPGLAAAIAVWGWGRLKEAKR